jgi:hypothetical protein
MVVWKGIFFLSHMHIMRYNVGTIPDFFPYQNSLKNEIFKFSWMNGNIIDGMLED